MSDNNISKYNNQSKTDDKQIIAIALPLASYYYLLFIYFGDSPEQLLSNIYY